jgi:hypothetical protein
MKAHLRRMAFFALVAGMPCGLASAHVETIIRLEGNKLFGLPSRYTHAELDLKALCLRINRHEIEFPPLLRSFFLRQPYDLEISASWYHEGPPYLVLRITPKGRDYSYDLGFELDTLSVDISVELRGFDSTAEGWPNMQRLSIALDDFDKKQINDSIKDVR